VYLLVSELCRQVSTLPTFPLQQALTANKATGAEDLFTQEVRLFI